LAYGPFDQPIEHGGGKVDRVDLRELATAATPGGANRIDDSWLQA
jgi:hypothetical protein